MSEAAATIGLTREKACDLLRYDPITGNFTWRKTVGRRARAGTRAGSIWPGPNGKRYCVITIARRSYPAHCLAYFIMTGSWPAHEVDHRDGDGINNCWGNLRPASKSQNQANAKIRRDNSVGFKGVSYHKGHKKYVARLQHNKRRLHLGCFDSAEDAHAAYCAAAAEYFGEFARSA